MVSSPVTNPQRLEKPTQIANIHIPQRLATLIQTSMTHTASNTYTDQQHPHIPATPTEIGNTHKHRQYMLHSIDGLIQAGSTNTGIQTEVAGPTQTAKAGMQLKSDGRTVLKFPNLKYITSPRTINPGYTLVRIKTQTNR